MAWKHDKSNTERGYGYKWKLLRDEVMIRDKGLCQPCYQNLKLTQATQVDHKLSKSKGGTDQPGNLQAICDDCHKIKTAEETGKSISHGCTTDGLPIDPKHHWN